jgi:hypothetical protein
VLFQIGGGGEVEQTAQMPAAAEPGMIGDDEDTLSGLDPVPVVDTAVIPAAAVEEHLQRVDGESAAGRPEPRRRILPLVLLVLLIAALVVLAAWGLSR